MPFLNALILFKCYDLKCENFEYLQNVVFMRIVTQYGRTNIKHLDKVKNLQILHITSIENVANEILKLKNLK